MRASVRDLRLRAGELLAAVERGESVEITYRGRPCARLTGIDAATSSSVEIREDSAAATRYKNAAGRKAGGQTPDPKANPAFGMWADRDEQDVEQMMEQLRAPRDFSQES